MEHAEDRTPQKGPGKDDISGGKQNQSTPGPAITPSTLMHETPAAPPRATNQTPATAVMASTDRKRPRDESEAAPHPDSSAAKVSKPAEPEVSMPTLPPICPPFDVRTTAAKRSKCFAQ